MRIVWHVALLATAACLPGTVAAQSAAGTVDFEKENDYYAARGSKRLEVVESYHLGPCQKLSRERAWPRAMNECNFILNIFPNHPSALLVVAQICEQWKSGVCQIEEKFERARSVNPTAPGTFVVQGIYLSRTKQYPGAIQSFERALELDADQVNAHYNLALTYIETKQFDLANAHAQRAYALGATLPGLRSRLKQAGHWNPVDPIAVRTNKNPASGAAAPTPSKSATGGK